MSRFADYTLIDHERDQEHAAELPQPEPDVAGCGWFDSSHELNQGLRVTEHAQIGSIVNDLPLGWWVRLTCPTPRHAA